jgi:Ca2+-binding RTX toxin-like protein
MTVFNYASLLDATSTLFEPTTDILSIEDPLLATNFRPSLSVDQKGITLQQIDPNDGSIVKTITLQFTAEADASNFYKIHTGMIAFQSGSFLVVGDNNTAAGDDSGVYGFNGSSTGDLMISFGANNNFTGNGGNDYFVTMGGVGGTSGSSGVDVFNGGSGIDTLGLGAVGGAVTGYVVNLGAGTGSVTGASPTSSFTVSGIENVDGSDGTDNITGDGNNNYLSGGLGADSIFGGLGTDSLSGGAGADTLNGQGGYDYGMYSGVFGDYTIAHTTGSSYTVVSAGVTDTISNIEELTFSGGGSLLLTSANISGGHVIDYAGLGNGSATAFDPANQVLAIQNTGKSAADFSFAETSTGVTLVEHDPVTGNPTNTVSLTFTAATTSTHLYRLTAGNIVFANGSMLQVGDNSSASNTADDNSNATLSGGMFNDQLISFGGAQLLSGAGGNDLLLGGDGVDTLVGGGGNDTLNGGTGLSRDVASYDIAGTTGGVTVNLTSGIAYDNFGGTDTLIGIEHVRGTNSADYLTGDANNFNQFLLTDLAKSFEGLGGNDFIDGGTSLPTNVAVVSYGNSTTGVTVNLAQGWASDGWGGQDTLINIDTVNGSPNADFLTGGSSSSQIIAAGHFEQFDGGSGNDTIDGGEGTDRASYQSATASVTVTLGEGVGPGAASGGSGNDVLYNIEQIRGSNYADTLNGNSGDNAFEGLGGNDTIHGGDGIDTIRFDQSIAAVSVTFSGVTEGSGTAGDGGFTGFAAGADAFDGIEAVRGSDGNDTLTGNIGDQILEGMAGNDTIDGGSNGTEGDTLSYGQSLSGVTVILNAGAATVTDSWGGTDTVTNMENIRGSHFADTLTGDANANIINAQGGNDTLTGGGGDDTIHGGFGLDTAVYSGLSTDYTVSAMQLDGSYTVTHNSSGSDGVDTLFGVERLSFLGGGVTPVSLAVAYDYAELPNDAELYFDPTRDVLTIGGGLGPQDFDISDIESGPNVGRGFMLREWDPVTHNAVKTVSLLFTTGSDPLNLFKITDSNIVFANGSKLMIGDNTSGTGDDSGSHTLNGSALNDILLSAGGNDTLNGGDGDDKLITIERQVTPGSSGTDYFDGGNGNDTLGLDSSQMGTIVQYTVNLATHSGSIIAGDIANPPPAYNSSFSVFNIENVDGSDAKDDITGDAGANYLRGNFGDDTLIGGLGNDTLDGGQGHDSMVGGDGFDVVDYSRSDGDMGPMMGGLTLSLAGGSSTWGPNNNDTLASIEGVIGSSWNDSLTGDANNNTFVGGNGNDSIYGGLGLDTAFYSGNKGDYTVTPGAGFLTVTDNRPLSFNGSNDGVDTLYGIEKLQFADGSTSLGGHLGTDFNGDGKNDLLWHNSTTAANYVSLMSGPAEIGGGSLVGSTGGWAIVEAKGDYNGDGKADLLWHNSTTAANYISLMSGATEIGGGSLVDSTGGWAIVESKGDYNGDGKTDLLWHNSTTAANYISLMSGAAEIGGGSLVGSTGGWAIVDSVSDFNGDGKSDLLWHNSTTAANYISLMSGAAEIGGGSLVGSTGGWAIVESQSDFNGDGKSDLLWHNSTTAANYISLMSGAAEIGGGSLPDSTGGWAIV